MAEGNSFHIWVEDSLGQQFLHTFQRNTPEGLAAAKKHARWWIQHRRRPGAHRDKGLDGKQLPSPIGKTRIMVEFYDDQSQSE